MSGVICVSEVLFRYVERIDMHCSGASPFLVLALFWCQSTSDVSVLGPLLTNLRLKPQVFAAFASVSILIDANSIGLDAERRLIAARKDG